MSTVTLRADSPKVAGETKDWIISIVADGLLIQYGRTGTKLRQTKVGIETIPDRNLSAELHRRIDEQLKQGYWEVSRASGNGSSPAASMAGQTKDVLYVTATFMTASGVHTLMQILHKAAGKPGLETLSFQYERSVFVLEIEGEKIKFKVGKKTHLECAIGSLKAQIFGMFAASFPLIDAFSVMMVDDAGQVLASAQAFDPATVLPEGLQELAYELQIRVRPLRFAPVQGATGQTVTPVVF